jgi:peptidoglycan-associated lipoprotein
MKYLVATITVAGALALAGCSKKAPEELPPPPVTDTTDTTGQTNGQAQGPAPGTQAHFAQVMSGRDTIYFDLDRYNIDSADQAALQTQAQYMARFPNVRATIEGHCDERGTRDYNLALGERRANAAKNYLVSLGVSADRLSTVSYGKERPVALGSNEQAWARNRRAVTIVLN